MKALMLSLMLFGCASSSFEKDFSSPYSTLAVTNRSGSTVRLFLASEGTTTRLGRAWPGKECFKLRFAAKGSPVAFGLQHQGRNLVWSPAIYLVNPEVGFDLEINQPELAIFDILGIMPARKC